LTVCFGRICCAVIACNLWLAGCASGGGDARAQAYQLAKASGFHAVIIPAGPFHLLAFLRFSAPAKVLRVYIEGDGHAWDTIESASNDPTPWSPVALELAAADPAAAVAYLARPCQYVPPGTDVACTQSLWTDARYSPAVIASINQALDRLKALAGASRLALVGFSGGGAVAVLAGARRGDLSSIRTVAADLDTALWTQEHGVTPLYHSLNPLTAAPLLAAVPQVHFVGGADRIVDLRIVKSFAVTVGPTRCLDIVVVPGLEHGDAWRAQWPRLLSRPWPARCEQQSGITRE